MSKSCSNTNQWWQEQWSDTPPVGYLLREAFPEHWFRIHSLPHARRYPASQAAFRTLLGRQASVATAVLGPNAQCRLFATRICYSGADAFWMSEQEKVMPTLPYRGKWQPVTAVQAYTDDPNASELSPLLQTWVAFVRWQPQAFLSLLRSVAEDAEVSILFASEQTGGIFAPYDGGADLFLRQPESRTKLRSRFAGWLSARPDGL